MKLVGFILVGLGWLIFLVLALMGGWLLWVWGKAMLRGVQNAFLRPGTGQVVAYEIFTPNVEEHEALDARPMVRLQLECEQEGRRFRYSLAPLTCEELFSALGLPSQSVACWMSEDDWQQLLEKRQVEVACSLRQGRAILLAHRRDNRQKIAAWLIALGVLFLLALAPR